ncbi:MAG TPA: extradiol ring-cleavage dioxygenase [Candidatus Binatia bacterium]
MANLVGCLAMSHAPQLMLDPDQWRLLRNRESERLPDKPGLEKETADVKRAKWRACMEAIAKLRERVDEFRPDVLIVVGDDQHENLVDDNMPPFTIFVGAEAEASTSLHYLNQPKSENRTQYGVDAKMAEALVTGLMDEGFDPSYSKRTRYAGGLGHAFARVLKFLSPQANHPIVPVMVNTYYPPAPSAKRCVDFGRALAGVLRRFPEDRRVAILASGGLSHTTIDEQLDREFIEALEQNDLNHMAEMRAADLVEGTSEIRNWIVAAAAAGRPGRMIDYIPLYRTTTGIGCAMGFAHWDLS